MKLLLLLLSSFYTNALFAQPSDSLLMILINKDSLSRIVQILASDSFGGRLAGSRENQMASEYIANQFQHAGLRPLAGLNGYFEPVPRQGSNVVGVLPGKSLKHEIIIFCAHFDHIGRRGESRSVYRPGELNQTNDSVYNGANDNASGMSAVIMLARYYAILGINERTLLFVGFTGEESGLIGSEQFAENVEPRLIKAVINLEMLGRGKSPFITGAEKTSLINLLNQRLFEIDRKKYKRNFFKKDNYFQDGLFERSDNYPFALKGIPAHTIISTPPNDRYYHSLHDEYSTLNMESMLQIVRATAIASMGLISGKDTPYHHPN